MPIDSPPQFLLPMSCFYHKELIVQGQKITVPCRKCLGCYIDESQEWSNRAKLELKLHDKSCFVSLTYDDEHVPEDLELRRSDVHSFLKRLRARLYPLKVRVYGCGEYGSEDYTQRPHYHLIIYGFCPDDLVYFYTNDDGDAVFKSQLLSELWQCGFITVGKVSNCSIRYCSLYMQKEFKDLVKNKKVQPFRITPSRPPLGFDALTDEELADDGFYVRGKKKKLPRAFLRRMENSDEWRFHVSVIKEKRREKQQFIEENVLDPQRDPLARLRFDKKKLDFYLKTYYNKTKGKR